jgi:hypothetical protein
MVWNSSSIPRVKTGRAIAIKGLKIKGKTLGILQNKAVKRAATTCDGSPFLG